MNTSTATPNYLADGSRMSAKQDEVVGWLLSYAGDFGFLVDMKRQLVADKPFTAKQLAAVERCYDREVARLNQPQAARKGPAEEGWYKNAEGYFKVQKAVHGNGRNYAKRLTQQDDGNWAWEYAPGAVYRLGEADRLTLEEAKAFGQLYGVCCVCGAILTDEKSIAEGIGPVCGGRILEWMNAR